MNISQKIVGWLENRAVTPAYAGWLLSGMTVFFFGSATNTMAGWLYALSGGSLALLVVAAVLPVKSLRSLEVRRRPIEPVSAGDRITIELEITNRDRQPKTLLQVVDILPFVLGKEVIRPIEVIEPNSTYRDTYYIEVPQRGIYRWQEVHLRTAAPLGLFWCRRSRPAKAVAVVYPQVLPLSACPLIDRIGQEDSPQLYNRSRSQTATEGLTRNLRPYRHGDPTRLIHWRTSARYGELRVRELEVAAGGQDIIIALDSGALWEAKEFERAVTVAASLYFYASKRLLNVKLWTAGTGLVSGNRVVLETLAAVNSGEEAIENRSKQSIIWLTQNATSLSTLSQGSRWVLWPSATAETGEKTLVKHDLPGLEIRSDRPLELQLQASIS
ncbi:DUF58 domain-containing protein [Tychonema sp. LEGE 07199]|uniref:DUF58 domain-containing protein n=1 Tax=unclassified Tychonema TaxID=2642144 RepID=UPI00187FC693|nr:MULTISPECIES: DUF58 domain-containing protein [unclassified Tychonema]MBE9119669.1 DUF58 domain-containing protein [Tychonema sp. LEGE 07199]MBE9130732.1 DUF58 domain-containing protein [Tychonema sp. LEGE 07196]